MAGGTFNPFGPRVMRAKGLQLWNGVRVFDGLGFPTSGPLGTGYNLAAGAGVGSIYVDKNTGVTFVNEGTASSPYWTPSCIGQKGIWGFAAMFADSAMSVLTEGTPNLDVPTLGVPLTDTRASITLFPSGLRVHGQGIAETDSGMTVAMDDQGAVATITTTDEDEHTLVLSFGVGTTPLFQPDQNGTIVMDALVAQSAAITLRGLFFGFCGSAADALDPVVTASAGTTISFATTIGDDVAGLYFDTGLTDGDRWHAPHDKGNANASIETTATGVDTGVDVAAAGTYQRLRVECDATGAVRMFIDKAQVASFAAGCLDTDEEIHPILQLISESAAVKSALVKHFMAYGKRA